MQLTCSQSVKYAIHSIEKNNTSIPLQLSMKYMLFDKDMQSYDIIYFENF